MWRTWTTGAPAARQASSRAAMLRSASGLLRAPAAGLAMPCCMSMMIKACISGFLAGDHPHHRLQVILEAHAQVELVRVIAAHDVQEGAFAALQMAAHQLEYQFF